MRFPDRLVVPESYIAPQHEITPNRDNVSQAKLFIGLSNKAGPILAPVI
jgi:hypothetical protein